MKSLLFCILLVGSSAFAREKGLTAFEALRLLPIEAAKKVAIIAGRDGTPTPERWYIVVFDPTQEHGLVEYAVAGNQIVAARTVSQFAEKLSAEDVIRIDVALFNSDRAYMVLEQFARANNLRISRVNYFLKKDGVGATPLWRLTGLDDSSTPFASMTVAATTGTIIHTGGFLFSPSGLTALNSVSQPESTRSAGSPAPATPAPVQNPSTGSERKGSSSAETRDAAGHGKRSRDAETKPGRSKPISRKAPESQADESPAPVAQKSEGFFKTIRKFFAR